MILGIDTSTDYLVITVMNDNRVIAHYQELCVRKQSEQANAILADIFEQYNIKPADITEVVCTRGPGSFTGVRIGLTIAKVITSMLEIPLYTISSLQYYLGNNYKEIILDARGNKVYYGYISEDRFKESMKSLNEIKFNELMIGDVNLISESERYIPNLKEHFLEVKDNWKLDSALDAVPNYIKEGM